MATFEKHVFISYSHIDNRSFGDPRGGWVDIFHEQLQNFVNVYVGRRAEVWRDKRPIGAEVFSDEIEQQLRSSAVLVSVISPGYMQSEWCNRELHGFTKAASGPRESSRRKSPAGRQGAPHSAVGNEIKQTREEPTASQAKSLRVFEAKFKNQER